MRALTHPRNFPLCTVLLKVEMSVARVRALTHFSLKFDDVNLFGVEMSVARVRALTQLVCDESC